MGDLVYIGTLRIDFRVFKPLKPLFYIRADPNLAAILDLAATFNLGQRPFWDLFLVMQ